MPNAYAAITQSTETATLLIILEYLVHNLGIAFVSIIPLEHLFAIRCFKNSDIF